MTYRTGDLAFDLDRREITLAGRAVASTPKMRSLLAYLTRNAGRLISREELLARLWPGITVSDEALTFQVKALRKALGSYGDYLVTVPKEGYRWDAPPVEPRRARPRLAIPAIAGAGLLALAAAAWVAMHRRSRASASPAPVRVAVLPFRAVGTTPVELGEGLEDSLHARLSSIPGLAVAPIRLIHSAAASGAGPEEIARRSHADIVVEGSVESSADAVEVRARVRDSSGGRLRWSGAARAEAGDRLSLEDRLAASVVRALNPSLQEAAIERWSAPATGDAAGLLLRARGIRALAPGAEGAREALPLLDRAIAADPGFAEAYAFRARATAILADGEAPDALGKAERDAREAVRLKPGVARAHSALGFVLLEKGLLDEAERELHIARMQDSSDADALLILGGIYRWAGLLPEAAEIYRLLLARDPAQPIARVRLADCLWGAGRPEEARRTIRGSERLGEAADTGAEEWEAETALWEGRDAEAVSRCDRLEEHRPVLDLCGYIRALAGAHRGDAGPAGIYLEATAAPSSDGHRHFLRGLIASAMGDTDSAYRELAAAEANGYQIAAYLSLAPGLEAVRGDPRYPALLARYREREDRRRRRWSLTEDLRP